MWKKHFCSHWISTKYHLDARNIDGIKEVYVNGVLKTNETNFDYNSETEVVMFLTASTELDTDNQDNVENTYRKVVSGYADRIHKYTLCTLLCVFDNRVFFSGNQGLSRCSMAQ